MGLLEKLKNTFFEEEYVEVEEPAKPEKVARKVEVKETKKEKKNKVKEAKEELDQIEESLIEEEKIAPKQESYSDRELVNRNTKLSVFDDDDFAETKEIPKVVAKPKEEKRIYGESASKIYESMHLNDTNNNQRSHTAYGATEARFQPTPIISPIYGVLDKNYRKEEVVDKKDKPSSYVSRKHADLDSVRRKAYGSASSYFMEDKENVEEDKPILYDMMEESKPVVGEVTVGDAEEYFNDLGLEYNVDYKDASVENEGKPKQKKETKRIEKTKKEDNKKEDNTDDDNLFDLIDSMYDGE